MLGLSWLANIFPHMVIVLLTSFYVLFRCVHAIGLPGPKTSRATISVHNITIWGELDATASI